MRTRPRERTVPDLTVNTTSMSNITTVVGRLGYTFDDRLGYAKAGIAQAKILTLCNGNGSDGRHRHNGFVVGIGAAKMITPNWSLGLEYDFVRLNGRSHVNAPYADANHRVTAHSHSIMLRATAKLY